MCVSELTASWTLASIVPATSEMPFSYRFRSTPRSGIAVARQRSIAVPRGVCWLLPVKG
jgi:hypothetical protein